MLVCNFCTMSTKVKRHARENIDQMFFMCSNYGKYNIEMTKSNDVPTAVSYHMFVEGFTGYYGLFCASIKYNDL